MATTWIRCPVLGGFRRQRDQNHLRGDAGHRWHAVCVECDVTMTQRARPPRTTTGRGAPRRMATAQWTAGSDTAAGDGRCRRREGVMSENLAEGLSEIMNHFGRKGGPQGVQHGQNVDDFLGDGAAHRT